MIPQWQQNIINSKIRNHIYVIEWLDMNENILDEVTVDVINGNMNFDSTRNSRSSANLTLKNLNKEYLPLPSNKLWINNRFRIKAGYEYNNGQKLLFNQGVFLLGNPSLLSAPSQKETEVEGLDKWCLLDGTIQGRLNRKTTIPVDTKIDYAIKYLVHDLGGENKYNIDPCNIKLPYEIILEKGDTIAKFINKLCEIVTYEAFYDTNGYFRFRKKLEPKDYNQTPISWSYTTTGLYLQSIRKINWTDVKNSMTVQGDIVDGVPIVADAKQTTGNFSIDKIGERLAEPINDEHIWSQELAQTRVDYELMQHIMVAEEVETNLIPNFSHQLDDVIYAKDNNNGLNSNYAIRSISYDLSYDTVMNIQLWGIKDWS